MLSPFQLGDVRSSCRPKWKELISENLLCCNKCRVLLVSCWWPFNVFSSSPGHCCSSRSLPSPPCPPRLRISAHEGKDFTATLKGYAEFEERVMPGFIIQPAASLQSRLMFFTGILALNIWLPESHSYNGSCWYAATWGQLSYLFYLSSICYARKNVFVRHPCDIFSWLVTKHSQMKSKNYLPVSRSLLLLH